MTATASPTIEDNTIKGGRFGVQVGESATPVVLSNSISNVDQVAIFATDTSAGRLGGNICTETRFGIVVKRGAHPQVDANRCVTITNVA